VTPTDEALVDRLAAGDPAALSELMGRYAPRLLRFATHYLHSAADADEVLQDVFVRADGAIRRGVRPDRVEAWLFRITVNRCRSRRRRWWPFVSGAAAEYALQSAPTPPDDDAMAWREEIQLALSELSPSLREAFLLKHVEGLDYEAMALITGAGVSALKMRVSRACERLRIRLQELNE
jgi:RNA polymerase sigma-70 factor (ECF subfamily)